MPDWQDYADLAFYGALNQNLLGAQTTARGTFQSAMDRLFNGGGFVDKAYDPSVGYLTYKVGLALHVGLTLGMLSDSEAQTLGEIILAQQETAILGKVGGFYTHYGQPGPRVADVNTETTALALWGLYNLAFPYRLYLPMVRR